MTNKFYTNVVSYGNNILYRGVKNGRRVKMKIQYAPTLFVESNKKTKWKSLSNVYLEPMKFESLREAKDFVMKYSEVSNFKIYGNTKYDSSFIAEEFPGQIDWDIEDIAIDVIDIEVGSENGFPEPNLAQEPITAICITRIGGGTIVYGCGEYDNYDDNVDYRKCKDEYSLCKQFLEDWQNNCPDVVTGWNIKFFDIPYLYNRLNKILGEEYGRKLSPWNFMSDRKTIFKGKEQIAYVISGVAILDYMELYMWYAPEGKSQENYRLDTIANSELGDSKLSYDEYDNLHQLYRLNYQKFIEYNIKDVNLIVRLEDKLKLLELGLTLAYDTKCNYDDIFAQTRMWDSLIYNYLIEKNIVVPPKEIKRKSSAFEGAYVKDPQIGMHDWVASFDLNSLYPHLIMQYNLSPETLIEPSEYTDVMRSIISSGISVDKLLNSSVNLSELKNATITPNGEFFRTDIKGFLPEMLEEMYEDRKKFKKLMLKAEQEYENSKDAEEKRDLIKQIAKYKNLQLAKKVGLNSAYGAMGSQYFRFYDLRIALAVTLAGQLSIRWIEEKINTYMNNLLKTDTDYVIASDTDSIYLRLGDLVNKVYKGEKETNSIIKFMDKVCESKLQPFIDKSYQDLATYVHAYAQKMQMKREGLSDKGIWTAKKRYILNVYNNEGVQYNEPKLKVMGLELKKSSTPAFIKDEMEKVVRMMIDSDENTIQEYMLEVREVFKKLSPEEVSFPRGVNGLDEYSDKTNIFRKGTPIHVRGALIYNDILKKKGLDKKYPLIQNGEKIKFVYLKEPNYVKSNVISYPIRLPKEFDLHDFIDYDFQYTKTFFDPIEQILKCIGWSGEKVSTLDSFFS